MTHRKPANRNWRPATIVMAIAVPLAAQFGLAGCAMGGMGDALPTSMGGLPEGAPARAPDDKYRFPAVHDMPAGRDTKPLDDAGQLQLQKDLLNLRAQQEKLAADPDAIAPSPPPQAKAQPAAKRNAAPAKPGQASGAKTNP